MAGYHRDRREYREHSRERKYDNTYESQESSNEGKLFVGGLAWDSTEESIKTHFEAFGPVESVNLKKNKEDLTKHRGFAFVTFVHAGDAEAALNHTKPHIIDGSKVDPKSACPLGIKPEQRTKKIFVGGLQTETTEEKLREYFGEFGEIQNNIEFAVDHVTKKRRGFCFIEFGSESVVDRIVKEKYHVVAGKKLETKRALTKQQQQELSATLGTDGMRRAAAMVSYGGIPTMSAASPYAQPVIYIHPDSLSTAYPMAALGQMAGLTASYPGLAQQYSTALETLYQPYSRESARHGSSSSRNNSSPSKSRYDPYRSDSRR